MQHHPASLKSEHTNPSLNLECVQKTNLSELVAADCLVDGALLLNSARLISPAEHKRGEERKKKTNSYRIHITSPQGHVD